MKRAKLIVIVTAAALALALPAGAEGNEDLKDAAGDLGDALKNFGQSLGSAMKEGIHEAGEAIESKSLVKATGVLKVGLFSKRYTLETDDGDFELRTISQSEDSLLKLSGYKNRTITVTGILDTETNVITLTTYSLADGD